LTNLFPAHFLFLKVQPLLADVWFTPNVVWFTLAMRPRQFGHYGYSGIHFWGWLYVFFACDAVSCLLSNVSRSSVVIAMSDLLQAFHISDTHDTSPEIDCR
jgi:hypothetical protein